MLASKLDMGLKDKGWYCSDEGLELEKSATHQTSQAKNMPYQPLLLKSTYAFNLTILRASSVILIPLTKTPSFGYTQ